MKITQIANILNAVTQEIIGESAVIAEDLSNVVDIGKQYNEIFGANEGAVDNFVKKLVDRIGRVIIVDRVYTSTAPDIAMDDWEYGSALEKIRVELPKATENNSWKLTAGETYNPFVYNPPTVSAKIFDSRVTFEIKMSYSRITVMSAFANAAEMSRFFAGIENRVKMEMGINLDTLKTRTINNLIAEKIHNNNNVVNLLKMYNTEFTATLTAAQAMRDKDFLRYACMQIAIYSDYITRPSMLFNNDGYTTFTPKDMQKLILLSKFAKATEVYLESDTYHNELVKLSGYSTVPYWQGSGTSDTYDFDEISKIDVKSASGNTVTGNGIIGVLFDRDGAGVCCTNYRVTSIFNPDNETTNYWYKWDAMYFNDLAENCVVFVVDDTAA